MKLSEVLVW